ncbi:IEC3 subunit of the Ino80 complex, chromatin re-modelling-domain-containing protein [Tuber borchii]|uniref:IEC3 subunit of the Ino80 complex, chromatin re-modelling-domain-containing protein n=1 Tax=Tuber borchii TaxID=42251 RepID=A0A2T6ZYR2_TUBBO|nr:IEC3 subunit of the Ino80 complex, chromatin re-modelling-domain-containing protein [Tuber borchii]
MSAAENAGGDKAHYKSYKKKYKKLRFKFDQVMKRSDELFKQDQIASAAIKRIQEENTRLLDLLVDLNSSSHVPKSRRFNIGSPSSATPTRFLSPTLLATMGGLDEEIAGLADDNDVEPMQLELAPVNGNNVEAEDQDDNSTDDDDDDETPPIQRHGAKYSDDEDEDMDDDDREAYLEEIRESNHRRGIPGTPPRYIRDKLKADAERERKEAEEQAKKAAAEVAANGVNGSAPLVLKQEPVDEMPEVLENTYRRGATPPYLRNTSPFLMSIEEEEAFYANVDENLGGEIPALPEIIHISPNASKGEGDPRNPMSVYCWLRKYQPQVFLQETEGERKPGRGRGGGRRRTAVDGDSGDEMPSSVKTAGSKRRRVDEGEETPNRGGRGPRGGRGGRRKPTEGGEPPVKKQRRLVARNS